LNIVHGRAFRFLTESVVLSNEHYNAQCSNIVHGRAFRFLTESVVSKAGKCLSLGYDTGGVANVIIEPIKRSGNREEVPPTHDK
jgi:hypothetical protein